MTIPLTPYQEAQYLEIKATEMADKVAAKAQKPPSVERAYIHLCRAVVAGVEKDQSDRALIALSLMVVQEWLNGEGT